MYGNAYDADAYKNEVALLGYSNFLVLCKLEFLYSTLLVNGISGI